MELIQDIRRSEQKSAGALPILPPFNDDVIHQTLEDIENQYNLMHHDS